MKLGVQRNLKRPSKGLQGWIDIEAGSAVSWFHNISLAGTYSPFEHMRSSIALNAFRGGGHVAESRAVHED